MSIPLEHLHKRRAEIVAQIRDHELQLAACNGALQLLDQLIAAPAAPTPPPPEAKPQTPR